MRTICVAPMAAALLVACSKPEPVNQAANPIPEVGVYAVAEQEVALTTDLPGRTAAYRVAEVRPQVNGIIKKRLFTEGTDVKQGQQLYQIDDATYQATYKRAKANLISAERLAKRYQRLQETSAVSRQQYDDAFAAWKQMEAEVELARINLEYTKVLAPISGRIGRSAVSEGALVSNGQPQEMATVQQLDPIYVDVTQPMSEMLRLQKEMASGHIEQAGEDQAKASLKLEDGSIYPHTGTLKFSEVSVDPGTGSVTLRAEFPNPEGRLLPGMFVHARISEGVRKGALLVPQQAVQRDMKGQATVWVVGPDNKASSQIINADRTVGNQWLVTSGLKAGDLVVTEGLQRVRPGIEVKASEASNVATVMTFGEPSASQPLASN